MAREEIIGRPLELWLAPPGEAFPALGDAPAGNWELVGRSGDENYTDDGVTVEASQSVDEFIPAGSTMAVKAFRTEEAVEIGVTVADVRAETWRLALNDNSLDETTGQRSVSLLRGLDVHEYALLARGTSPYEDDGDNAAQFQVPRCYMSAEPEVTYNKGEPAALELSFRSLKPDEDDEDDFALVLSDATVV